MKVADLDAWADEYVGSYHALARNDFAFFRQLIHPEMLWGWWTDEVARELSRFYRDLIGGRRPKLALMAPPQPRQILDYSRFHRLDRRQGS